MSDLVVWSKFPEFAASMPEAVSKIVRKAAFDVQAEAQRRAPIRTGFLRSSVYVRMRESSNYGAGLIGGGPLLPEVTAPTAVTTAIVAVGAAYGLYIEQGTRNKPPRPFLLPAADKVRPAFVEAFAQLEAIWASMGV